MPNLDKNIIFGNSLIDFENTTAEDQNTINPFNFGEMKFDVIVGNPPYMATEHMKQFTPLEFPLYKIQFSSSYKQFDKYFLFIERGLGLLAEGGFLGFIIPNKFTKVGAGKKLRELLVESKSIQQIISFGANQIFKNKTTYTALIVLQMEKREELAYFEINDIKSWRTRNLGEEDFELIDFSELDNDGWILVPQKLKPVFKAINAQSENLEKLIGPDSIYNGIQTSANKIYIHSATYEDDEYLYFSKDGVEWKVEKALTRPYFRTSAGSDNLNTYRPFTPNSFVIYPYLKSDEGIKFVEIEQLKSDFPNTFLYLSHYQDQLDNPRRDIKPTPKTPDEWYRYGRHQSLDKCDVPAKIIVGVLSQGDKYAIDYYGTLISSGGTAGYCMITLPDDSLYSIYYIQALLNSKYLEWYSALIGEVFRGGYIARGTKVLKKLPIRIINFNDEKDSILHNKIATVQKELINLQGKIDKSSGNKRKLAPLQRQFDIKKNKLDNLLKTLYDLGEYDSLIPLIKEVYAIN